jgi:hypothetical protein
LIGEVIIHECLADGLFTLEVGSNVCIGTDGEGTQNLLVRGLKRSLFCETPTDDCAGR